MTNYTSNLPEINILLLSDPASLPRTSSTLAPASSTKITADPSELSSSITLTFPSRSSKEIGLPRFVTAPLALAHLLGDGFLAATAANAINVLQACIYKSVKQAYF